MVTEAFADDRLQPPSQLVYSGFDTLSPAQQALLDAVAGRGCAIRTLDVDSQSADSRRTRAPDAEAEIRLAAHWAAQRLRDAPDTGADWPAHGRTWSEQRYSPLDILNKDNVENLVPAWAFSLGGEKQRGQETQHDAGQTRHRLDERLDAGFHRG